MYLFVIDKIKGREKKAILAVLLILTLMGLTGFLYDSLFYNFFSLSSIEVLDKSSRVATEFFLKLSSVKALVAIIEGSTINFGIGLSGSVEFGDVVQPLYDFVDIIWKISMVNFLFLNLQKLLFQVPLKEYFTIASTLIILINLLPKKDILIRINKVFVIVFVTIFFIMPTYTSFAQLISMKVEEFTIKFHEGAIDEAIVKLEELEDEISNIKGIAEEFRKEDIVEWKMEGQFIKIPKASINSELMKVVSEDVTKRIVNLKQGLESLSRSFFTYFFAYLSLYIFNLLIIPLVFILVVYSVKYVLINNR